MTVVTTLKKIFAFHWNPGKDLVAVAISWLLVVGVLYTATVIVGTSIWGGMAYFFLYALLGATLCGIGIPLCWMAVVRKRPLADLGITTRWLWPSLALQLVFAFLQFMGTLAKTQMPPLAELMPLITLSLAIGLFEAIFWRGGGFCCDWKKPLGSFRPFYWVLPCTRPTILVMGCPQVR